MVTKHLPFQWKVQVQILNTMHENSAESGMWEVLNMHVKGLKQTR